MKYLPTLMSVILTLFMTGCSEAGPTGVAAKKISNPGAQGMKTYHIGRFAIDLPAEFTLAAQRQVFRLVEIKEQEWGRNESPGWQREKKWQERLTEIEKLRKPKGIKKTIIKEEAVPGIGKWARAVLYYGDYMADDEAHWDFFVDYGNHAVTFHLGGLLDKEMDMKTWIEEVARMYSSTGSTSSSNAFATKYGEIHLPYLRQESSYARFEGHPLLDTLEIKTSQIHEVEPENEGLVARLAASVGAGFAAGVKVDKLRGGKRKVAGLSGEELVLQMDDGSSNRTSFLWRFAGKPESGHEPQFTLDLENDEKNVQSKLKLWETILNSVRHR